MPAKILKIPKERWVDLVQEHQNGKSVGQIMRENPEVKKSTFRYHIKQVAGPAIKPALEPKPDAEPDVHVEQGPEINATEPAPEPKSDPEPAAVKIVPKPVRDNFLEDFAPDIFQSNSKPEPLGKNVADSIFSLDDIFTPENLATPQKSMLAAPKSSKGCPLGKTKSWWLTGKSKIQKAIKHDPHKEDNDQLALVQKIRLYFVHFPELKTLHVVPKNKSGAPDVEKYLVSLYTKKTPDLEKLLNFVRFHVRNSIAENSSMKLASNVLETSVRVLEHTLMLVGIKSKGLSDSVMEDKDVLRCVKEIMIDNSIASMAIGPKSDLVLKLGMKLVSIDSQNRIEEKIAECKPKQQPANGEPTSTDDSEDELLSPHLQQKYDDL